MAEDHISLNPTSGGSGATPVTVKAINFLGRTARRAEASLRLKATPTIKASCIINQNGEKGIDFQPNVGSIAWTGGSYVMNVLSNLERINWKVFLKMGDAQEIEIPDPKSVLMKQTLVPDGVDIGIGDLIPGDPGATWEYRLELQITVPANQEQKIIQYRVVGTDDENVVTSQFTLSQESGAPFININPNEIEFNASGGYKSINVVTNGEWEVESIN